MGHRNLHLWNRSWYGGTNNSLSFSTSSRYFNKTNIIKIIVNIYCNENIWKQKSWLVVMITWQPPDYDRARWSLLGQTKARYEWWIMGKVFVLLIKNTSKNLWQRMDCSFNIFKFLIKHELGLNHVATNSCSLLLKITLSLEGSGTSKISLIKKWKQKMLTSNFYWS